MTQDAQLRRFWGKTESDQNKQFAGSEQKWHPAIYHMVDVGCVAQALLEHYLPESFTTWLFRSLGLVSDNVKTTVSFLCASHDIGKISPGFQRKVPELFDKYLGDMPYGLIDTTNHGAVTYKYITQVLQNHGFSRKAALALGLVLGAHHGTPSSEPFLQIQDGGPKWRSARDDTLNALLKVFDAPWPAVDSNSNNFSSAVLMAFAGLTSVADWIGSDQSHFPPSSEVSSLDEYVERARAQALKALNDLGWRRSAPAPIRSFTQLFPNIASGPNQLQQMCAELAGGANGPFLLLVEAPMGIGKTEAALWAAEIGQTALGSDGIYYALPTQATSNAMFERVAHFLQNRRPDQTLPFHLLHGMASLNELYSKLIQAGGAVGVTPSNIGDTTNSVSEDTLVAREWFLGRKRGLLAPYAVGTIDQALMGALRVRHVFVRLFALAHKTIVIDEVHAYDAYMSQILDRLLEWLRALGSNVILLSATLPQEKRQALLATYGSNHACEVAYPRVTIVKDSGATQVLHVPGVTNKDVIVSPVSGGIEGAIDALHEKLRNGGCGALICNTVTQAQKAFKLVESDSRFSGLDPKHRLLFHARFPMEQRLVLEATIQDLYGKNGDNRPAQGLVVATQVIEQSLDLDFDVMISELAPCDLLLQRSGRMHRHDRPRPDGLRQPELMWIEPSMQESCPSFGGSALVYEPLLLLRTWRFLCDPCNRQLRIHDDMDRWIAQIYSDKRDETERPFTDWQRQIEKNRRSDKMNAQTRILFSPEAADPALDWLDATIHDDEVQALARLCLPTVNVACVFEINGRLYFDECGRDELVVDGYPTKDTIRRVLRRVVRLYKYVWDEFRGACDQPSEWQRAALLRNVELAPFRNGVLVGPGKSLLIDNRFGVIVE